MGKIMTRMGDGFPVEMTEKKLMGDLVEGTEDAAEYGRIPALSKEELQYLFDREVAKDAFDLELQLDWYDSRTEFEVLVKTARSKARYVNEESLGLLVAELIKQAGAFPDKSIIAGYEAEPGLRKLPDYIVARTIEEIIA